MNARALILFRFLHMKVRCLLCLTVILVHVSLLIGLMVVNSSGCL